MDTMTGTPAYLSPEQIRGEALSSRSDIYSLGITLFEMLTGVQPFTGTLTQILDQHLSDTLPSTRDYAPELPSVIDRILRRATAKKPRDRYRDALALAEDFRRASQRG
jgi:serine/threonine-protein kinase